MIIDVNKKEKELLMTKWIELNRTFDQLSASQKGLIKAVSDNFYTKIQSEVSKIEKEIVDLLLLKESQLKDI